MVRNLILVENGKGKTILTISKNELIKSNMIKNINLNKIIESFIIYKHENIHVILFGIKMKVKEIKPKKATHS